MDVVDSGPGSLADLFPDPGSGVGAFLGLALSLQTRLIYPGAFPEPGSVCRGRDPRCALGRRLPRRPGPKVNRRSSVRAESLSVRAVEEQPGVHVRVSVHICGRAHREQRRSSDEAPPLGHFNII